MTLPSTTNLVFPVHDRNAAQAAVPVVLAVAKMLDAPLNLVVSRQACADVRDLERALAMPDGTLDGASVESANGDFVAAVERVVRRVKPALLLLAVRLRDDEGAMGTEGAARSNPIERQVMERVPCPVLVVPPDQDASGWRLRRELLPQDGSPECVVALDEIIDRSSSLGIENIVLRVAGARVGQPTAPGSLPTPRYVDHPQYEWDAWTEEFLARIAGARVDAARLRLLMAAGEPGQQILRVAREEAADMIILPWHRTLACGRARMVKTVLDGAVCPVLLLPQRRVEGG